MKPSGIYGPAPGIDQEDLRSRSTELSDLMNWYDLLRTGAIRPPDSDSDPAGFTVDQKVLISDSENRQGA